VVKHVSWPRLIFNYLLIQLNQARSTPIKKNKQSYFKEKNNLQVNSII
jgi:hypothetical protein